MKIHIASIMLALILPLAACEKKVEKPGKTAPESSANVQQGKDNVTKNWVDYASKDKSYKVKFPGQPTEQIKTANSKLGKLNVVLAFYEEKTAKRAYLASSFKYEVDPTKFDATKGLEGAKSAIAKNGTITSAKDINFNGFPGKELTLTAKQGIGIRAKFFIDPKVPTLYQTQVLAADGQTDFPEADAFFDSFSLNK
ncbi:MAG TPA: hypothetical protein V6C58_13290 [Allocoleopsis sp.]